MTNTAPMYITPHHAHDNPAAALGALQALHGKYPLIRFGVVYQSPRWLVYRVHEQHQQGAALPESLSDGLTEVAA
ncbi:MAG: hypothetical protein Q4G28_01870 [Neisseria sp.]|nr:hypothetical protein [Neisseria sp.]